MSDTNCLAGENPFVAVRCSARDHSAPYACIGVTLDRRQLAKGKVRRVFVVEDAMVVFLEFVHPLVTGLITGVSFHQPCVCANIFFSHEYVYKVWGIRSSMRLAKQQVPCR